MQRLSRRVGLSHILCLALLAAVGLATPAAAYIGPGAGFALATSVGVIFFTIIVAVLAVLTWPFRMLWRLIRRPTRPKAKVKRLIFLGFDGQDPRLTDRWMAEDKLPHFEKLAELGCYHKLHSTYPSISPVAWSSFATGVQPAKHNIFDFLSRDTRTYLPLISSTTIESLRRRGATLLEKLRFGRYRLPVDKALIRSLRKAKPYWTILGEHYIWSTVLRVPITFPPDRFYGAQLGAMAIPDLLGTQGTFYLFTTRSSDDTFKEGGTRVPLDGGPDRFEASVVGPENSFVDGSPPMELPLVVRVDRPAGVAHIELDGQELALKPGALSDWVSLEFPAAPTVKVSALVRIEVTEMDEHVSIYMTPLNISPENPAMPISHPGYYANYLAKKVGPYSTLGLAEDTWALNVEVTSDATFLEQSYDIDREREGMFMASLDQLRKGSLVCVFDGTDRIQHMFWRYLEEGHPAGRGKENAEHKNAIEELYVHNDELLGRTMKKLKKGDLLFVISDHGFTSFRRGVNINAWLHANGYLKLKEGADGSNEWLVDVDWSATRAYSLGLAGMYLNIEGREAHGIVKSGAEARALKDELVARLSGVRDEERGEIGITEVFDTSKLYSGPYLGNAPDILFGFNSGYRVSWDCATGMISGPVFEDNTKAWSGDHCVDPRQVPGIMFCNYPIDDDDPALMDMAPTALGLFGIEPPAHMDGKSLFDKATEFDPQRGVETAKSAA
ncbi:MAG: alkaline phosphatase family protein [Acidobacteria bacterium]|nr:alkaline phosphatase family protein [Acidobacteriota bacterium]